MGSDVYNFFGDYVCPTLPETIPIKSSEGELGYVETKPLMSQPVRLEDLLKASIYTTVPFYLDYVGMDPCIYPVQTALGPSQTLDPRNILPKNFSGSVRLFGTPTSLVAGDGKVANRGVLYDPSSDLFYTTDVTGLNWYLMGDSRNYVDFIKGTLEYSTQLYLAWKKNPIAFFSILANRNSTPSSLLPSPDHANKEIEKFLSWLKKNDPVLYGEVSGITEYRVQVDTVCNQDEWFAYFDPSSGKIYALPPIIQMMKKEEYPGVAQIIAHERAHLRSIGNRLVPATQELMAASLNHFLGRIGEGWMGMVLLNQGGSLLYEKLQCELLPFMHEEEAYAHAEEFAYTADHPFVGYFTPQLQQDALTAVHDSWEELANSYPSEWFSLGAQYYLLAQESHQPYALRSKNSRDIQNILVQELLHTFSCIGDLYCFPHSTGFSQLQSYIPVSL